MKLLKDRAVAVDKCEFAKLHINDLLLTSHTLYYMNDLQYTSCIRTSTQMVVILTIELTLGKSYHVDTLLRRKCLDDVTTFHRMQKELSHDRGRGYDFVVFGPGHGSN